MAKPLVLITGASGHIGFLALVQAFKSGYSVLAAVRSSSKEQEILSAPSIRALNPGSVLKFIIIPDLAVLGAYDEAVKGVTYILHLAFPMVMKGTTKPEDYQSKFIDPAVTGTLNILKSAVKEPTIKRIVIASSVAAILDAKYAFEIEPPEGLVIDYKSRTSFAKGPQPSDFHASKTAALDATESFVAQNNPSFDITNIHPSMVIGKNELATKVEDIMLGSNATAIAPVLDNKSDTPLLGATVHVNDIAFMHVKALDASVPAGSYIGNSEGYAGTVWQNAMSILAEKFPKAVEGGILLNNGIQTTWRLRVQNGVRKLWASNLRILRSRLRASWVTIWS